MNREEEAIRYIKDNVCYGQEECFDGICKSTEDNPCAIETAIEALAKQQTTKYKHLWTRHTHWGKCRHDKFRCETCGFTKEFTDNHTAQYKYCPSCGRESNWRKPKGNDCDFMFIDEVIAYDTQKKD